MAASDGTIEKICTLCGEDVSGKPRVKDARGRYYCKPCAEQAEARARAASAQREPDLADLLAEPKPAVLGDADADLLDELAADAAASIQPAAPPKKCPGCAGQVDAGAVICTDCGFDFRTGRKVEKQISQTTVEMRAKGKRGRG